MDSNKFNERKESHTKILNSAKQMLTYHQEQLKNLPEDEQKELLEFIENLISLADSYFDQIELMQQEHEALLELYLSQS